MLLLQFVLGWAPVPESLIQYVTTMYVTSLFGQAWSKNKNCQFKLKFGTGAVHFFWFRPETPFFGKFGPENQTCQFKLKFGT